MKKAIVVIDDIPDYMSIEDCSITYVVYDDRNSFTRANMCLRPMPEKKNLNILLKNWGEDQFKCGIGYNKCIDELSGEGEEHD